ncbi:MAG: tol-pal system protein YbgF [Salinarimonas sp.]|nr:tol-pal system protein YbgF [Salinarimonas sp.]
MKALPISPVLGFFARALAVAALIAGLSLLVPASVKAQDMSEVVLRLNQLEGQVRSLSGQVEELQFENRQLRDRLQRMQEDVDFRFDEMGAAPGPQRSGQNTPPADDRAPATPAPQMSVPDLAQPSFDAPAQQAGPGRGDAFDPGRDPLAPGTPQPLGTTSPSAPLALPGAILGNGEAEQTRSDNGFGMSLPQLRNPDLNGDASEQGNGDAAPRPSIAATGDADPRNLYDSAYALLLQGAYDDAEMGFRQFLQSHPRDALAPQARYWLGESYRGQGRYREAAEQYLTVSTEYAEADVAPQAMLRLGGALAEIGAQEQACATLAEIPLQYPQAASALQENIAREEARAGCA